MLLTAKPDKWQKNGKRWNTEEGKVAKRSLDSDGPRSCCVLHLAASKTIH